MSLFNKLPGLRHSTLLKKKLLHRCFPLNFAKFKKKKQVQKTRQLFLTTRTVVLDILKAFGRVCHPALVYKLKLHGISNEVFSHIPLYVSNTCLLVLLDRKSSKECLLNSGVPPGSNLGPTLFLIIYLMMFSVILMCILVILLSTRSITQYLVVVTTKMTFDL